MPTENGLLRGLDDDRILMRLEDYSISGKMSQVDQATGMTVSHTVSYANGEWFITWIRR
jgi:hypothetical protein